MVDVERRRRNSTETLVIKDEHVAKKDGEEDGERQREMGMGKSNPNNRWAADSWKDEGSFSDSGTVRGTANNGKDAHSIDEGRARTQHLLSPPPSALGLLATSNTTSTTATTIVTGTTSVPCMLNQTTASSASSSTSQRFLAPPTSGTIRATKAQLKVLQKIFAENQMPSGQMHSAIADSIGMTRSTVRNWFQNQRAKTRRLQMEAQAHSQQAQVQQAHIQAAPKNNNNSRLYNYPPRADSFSDVGSNLGSNLSSFDSRYPPSHVASNVNNYAAQPIPFNLQFSSQQYQIHRHQTPLPAQNHHYYNHRHHNYQMPASQLHPTHSVQPQQHRHYSRPPPPPYGQMEPPFFPIQNHRCNYQQLQCTPLLLPIHQSYADSTRHSRDTSEFQHNSVVVNANEENKSNANDVTSYTCNTNSVPRSSVMRIDALI